MAKLTKIPRGAMRFVDNKCSSAVFSNEGEDNAKLNMTIYSGKVIKNHWWWGNLAIDLDGLSFQSKKTPILESHDPSKKIAFSDNILVSKEFGVKVDPDKTTFVDTEESKEFQKLSRQGFPYQASIAVDPSEVVRLGKDETAEVNGFTMKGPDATIFRKATVKEGSVCVFGWDTKTQSSAFSKEEVDVDINIIGEMSEGEESPNKDEEELKDRDTELNNDSKEERKMEKLTLVELEKSNPELLASIREDAIEEVEAKFAKEKEGLEAKIEESNTKVAKLEKKDVIRTEKELKSEANSIFSEVFNKSDVPERLFQKVRNMLNHSKFVSEDILDVEAWSKACQDEVKSFEDAGVTDTVIGGGGFNLKDSDTDKTNLANEEKESTELADDFLESVGQYEEKGGK